MPDRRRLLKKAVASTVLVLTAQQPLDCAALAFAQPTRNIPSPFFTKNEPAVESSSTMDSRTHSTIAYQPLTLRVSEFGVNVPVAAWYPLLDDQRKDKASVVLQQQQPPARYQHRISVRRIGQLLARWDFIPDFVSRNYSMAPSSTTTRVVDASSSSSTLGPSSSLSQGRPVVLLAHGFLGSRFDLSHLAEELAAHGFTCLAAEYPESLAASYERVPGLDRRIINNELLRTLTRDWNMNPTAYGIVGHSLGCGTVAQTGDASWARVSIAGFPQNNNPASAGLLLTSMNDGAVSIARRGGISLVSSANYELLDEASVTATTTVLPRRAALVFDRPDAPNHISFLAEGVNDAMIELLSPLLPVAQVMGIPVLDFDRYQVSRDSKETAAIVLPLIVRYLKQEMKVSSA